MKKEVPFFSIILPVYNVEKYLKRCIKSILSQSFTNFELILVDDGSMDNCPTLCDEWRTMDARVKVIHKKNAGLGMARNTGLKNAIGKYVFFIDSDDYILPGLLDDAYTTIQLQESNIVFYGFQRVDAEGNILNEMKPTPSKLFYDDADEIMNVLFPAFIAKDPYSGISFNIRISAWNCCISKAVLEEHNLRFVSEREFISEDIYFYIELFQYLKSVSFINKIYYSYCQNEGSLTFSYKEDRYSRLKNFYVAANKLVKDIGYCEEVCFRLKETFISNVMACLKMEAANSKKCGFVKSYINIKKIGNDEYFREAISKYPLEYYGSTWHIFFECVKKKRFRILMIILLAQYRIRGI